MDFNGNQMVQGPYESFSAASKGFKRHEMMNKGLLEHFIWTLNHLIPNEVHYMEKILECFHQKPSFIFD